MAYNLNNTTVINDSSNLRTTDLNVAGSNQYIEIVKEHTFQGETAGYTANGRIYSPASNTFRLDKFPFASDANATNINDLAYGGTSAAGHSSKTHGYNAGGRDAGFPPFSPATFATIYKFSFGSSSASTNIGNLTQDRNFAAGSNSQVSGYTAGGFSETGAPLATNRNTIDKFPFSTDTNATDVGDLTGLQNSGTGQSSTTHGYITNGVLSANNEIQKYSFASDANSTAVGTLSYNGTQAAGQSSTTHGYTSGGYHPPQTPNWAFNNIDRFPFSTDTNATDVGDITVVRARVAGQSSTTSGYTSGGYFYNGFSGTQYNVIDKFPFASNANATDVGDLTQSRYQSVGTQD